MGSGEKKMRSSLVVLIVIMLVVGGSSELGWCWGDAIANAKEHLNIAANWAQEKFAGGGLNKETTDGVKDKAAGAAGAMNTAASDASKYASDKADQVGGMATGGHQQSSSSRSTIEVEEEQGRSSSSSSEDKFDDLKNSYDETVKKVGESYNTAKHTISDNTKQTYDSAKEMASDAAAKVTSRQEANEL